MGWACSVGRILWLAPVWTSAYKVHGINKSFMFNIGGGCKGERKQALRNNVAEGLSTNVIPGYLFLSCLLSPVASFLEFPPWEKVLLTQWCRLSCDFGSPALAWESQVSAWHIVPKPYFWRRTAWESESECAKHSPGSFGGGGGWAGSIRLQVTIYFTLRFSSVFVEGQLQQW